MERTEQDAAPRLRVDGVSKSFGAVHALRGVSFDVQAGEIHALVGENGAGKSTLVGIITGIRPGDAGVVSVDGVATKFKTPLDARAAGIAAMYQDPNLFPHLSVAENIMTGQFPRRGPFIDHAAMKTRARELLADVGFEIDVDQMVAGLTVAEAQFVEIARALSSDLRVLILDEPTSALTPSEAEKLYEVVRRLRDAGTAIIWISHRMEEIRALADTITVLRDGQHVITSPSADLSDDEMIRQMVGRSVVLENVARTEPLGDVCLKVSGLSLPGVFDDIDFEIREGEIVAMAGLVGAGRSEIAQALFGLSKGVEGEVEIHGETVAPRSPRQMADLGLVYLPENRDAEGIISTMPIVDNIALPSLKSLGRGGIVDSAGERRLAEDQRSALSIKGEIGDLVSSLSGGNRQKVAIARWLAKQPTVLLLDEPTHGIDVGTKAQVHDIMRELARKQRMGILMISSDMLEVLAVSDRVLVLSRGRIVVDLETATATQESILAAATQRATKATVA
jgi:rhamnose transport system ATP-binding protein